MKVKYLSVILMILSGIPSFSATADDEHVRKARLLNAGDFDETLPDQPVAEFLDSNMPAAYKIIWGERITDCGEASGTAADRERDMPMCAEVEFRKGSVAAGYLALLVGTRKKGLFEGGAGIYFGYIEHNGIKYNIRKLGDLLEIRQAIRRQGEISPLPPPTPEEGWNQRKAE